MIRTAVLSATMAVILGLSTVTPADSWKHNPGHGKGKAHSARGESARGGPPPWAPAHGYRRKHGGEFYEDVEVYARHAEDRGMAAGTCNREAVGAVLGGVVGGVLGSQVGKGDGQKLATIAGAVVGVLVGRNIGRRMDETDTACTGQALERVPDHQTITWHNLDSQTEYRVTPTQTYEYQGRYCRQYITEAVVDGQPHTANGVACRNHDGSWQAAPEA